MSVLISGVDVFGHPGPQGEHSLQSPQAADKLDDEQRSRLARSKPHYHVTAPSGWQNDPCGLGYDPSTGLYHLFFQWNPYGNDWGNMSWGHATSSDLVSWETSPTPAMTPSEEYDRCGVFTGCMRATDIHGNPGGLTVAYTSVRHLPIHFTLPYTEGSESLSLATSKDGGRTWQREVCNPILPGHPQHLKVTGWRDPYLTTWDRGHASQNQDPNLYGFISGGILGQTPTIFVYSVNPKDLRQWKYTGLLTNVGLNFCPSRWSGDFGVNWEVTNLMTLTNDGYSRDFVVVGAEGCLRPDGSDRIPGEARHRRDPRGQLWMSVKASEEQRQRTAENVLTEYAFAGIFDHGCLYAANSFWDPQTSRRIVYGWVTEEDLPDGPRHRQGWSGMISLPRVVDLMTLRNVKKARSSQLHSITSIETIPNGGSNFTILTLGITPDPRLARLRQSATKSNLAQLSLCPSLASPSKSCLPLMTARWELTSEFSVGQSCGRVGIEIAHTAEFEHCTTLAWHPYSETFTIHRPPLENPDTNHGHESAPHTLFTSANGQGQETEETLRVHAFFDKSVLEVFVNERTVITTRIYHPSDRCFGIRFFAEPDARISGQTQTTLLRADVWDGLHVN